MSWCPQESHTIRVQGVGGGEHTSSVDTSRISCSVVPWELPRHGITAVVSTGLRKRLRLTHASSLRNMSNWFQGWCGGGFYKIHCQTLEIYVYLKWQSVLWFPGSSHPVWMDGGRAEPQVASVVPALNCAVRTLSFNSSLTAWEHGLSNFKHALEADLSSPLIFCRCWFGWLAGLAFG